MHSDPQNRGNGLTKTKAKIPEPKIHKAATKKIDTTKLKYGGIMLMSNCRSNTDYSMTSRYIFSHPCPGNATSGALQHKMIKLENFLRQKEVSPPPSLPAIPICKDCYGCCHDNSSSCVQSVYGFLNK